MGLRVILGVFIRTLELVVDIKQVGIVEQGVQAVHARPDVLAREEEGLFLKLLLGWGQCCSSGNFGRCGISICRAFNNEEEIQDEKRRRMKG